MANQKKFLLVLLLALLLAGCHVAESVTKVRWPNLAVGAAPPTNVTNGCVADFQPGTDYFPAKAKFRHSAQLTVTYHGHYKVVTFTPTVDTGEELRYALVQCGTPAPPGFRDGNVVNVPVRSFTTSNHSILSAVVALEATGQLAGVSNRFAITEPTIRKLAMNRQVLEVGGGAHSTIELTLAVSPDVHFTFYSAYPEFNLHPKLWEAGVRAAPMSDHTETTPLGRTEWLKYLALFLNKEGEAERQFAAIEGDYERLRALTRNVNDRPVVMAGIADGRDVWDLSGGRNHYGRLIYDAGGQYFWNDNIAGSYVMANYERVFERGGQAHLWIHGPSGIASRGMLIAKDRRYSLIRPVKLDRVYALDRGYSAAWTFPYVDQGLTQPHLALADLIRVLHPEIALAHENVFARRLDSSLEETWQTSPQRGH